MFEYLNASSEGGSSLASDSIQIDFTTEYTQIYVYAILVCLDDDLPTEESLRTGNVTDSQRSRYYSEILNISGEAKIVFPNLIRNNPYKLYFIIESTQGVLIDRTRSSIVLENVTLSDGSIIPIQTANSVATSCASYRFETRPGRQLLDPLLWYWQREFSYSGFSKSGCINALDQYGTVIAGMPDIREELSCGRSNCRFIDREDYIVNKTQTKVPETYTICAYPSSSCETDYEQYQEKFEELATAFGGKNDTMGAALMVKVVPAYTVSTLNADTKPTVPTSSTLKLDGAQISFDSTSASPILCFARLTSEAKPSEASFNTCGKDCTTMNVSPIKTEYKISIGVGDDKKVEAGTYNVYAICYNDMHCSTTNTGVFTLGSITISQKDADEINDEDTSIIRTETPTEEDTISTEFFKYSLTLLVLLLALLI
jgi:hypothetical protein